MMKLVSLVMLFSTAAFLGAQTSGEILYEETVDIHRRDDR